MVSTTNIPQSLTFSHIRPVIKELQPQLVTWRRSIHQKPELGFQEHLTAVPIAIAT